MSYSYMITFGNSLNKVLKNNWLEKTALHDIANRQPLSPLLRGDTVSAARKSNLRQYTRSLTDDQLHQSQETYTQNLQKKLTKVQNKELFDRYDDIRMDNGSNQYVGFPKVSGYMEVPLGVKHSYGDYFDDANRVTDKGAYMLSKGMQMTPRRPRNLKHELNDLFGLENVI